MALFVYFMNRGLSFALTCTVVRIGQHTTSVPAGRYSKIVVYYRQILWKIITAIPNTNNSKKGDVFFAVGKHLVLHIV